MIIIYFIVNKEIEDKVKVVKESMEIWYEVDMNKKIMWYDFK